MKAAAIARRGLAYPRTRQPGRPARVDPLSEPEAVLQRKVLELAALHHWRAYHTYDARRSQPGFPDLVLLRPPRLVFIELKAQDGELTLEQAAWLCELHDAGQEAYVFRPSDWLEIVRTLQP